MPQVRYVGTAVLLAKARQALVQGVTEGAEDLVGQAQDLTPVDTGTLKASIHVVEIVVSSASVKAKVATGGEANEYAAYVHEGTYKMGGRPFLTEALVNNADVYRAHIAAAAARQF